MSGMVIVGGGQAGYSISSKLRSLGFKGRIDLVCGEKSLPYQRPPLSKKFLMGEIPRERLFFRPESFYKEKNITLKLGVTVLKIDRSSCKVQCSDGSILPYKKLFLATGSTPKVFPANLGGDLEKNYYIRSLTDIDIISHEFKSNKRLLIIGGGYIGLEIAAIARKKNLEVVLVEAEDRILQRVACSQTARFIKESHLNNGVKIIEGRSIDHIVGKQNIFVGAVLDSGEKIFADFCIIGIGAKPCTNLADSSGLVSENGIWVDNLCQTTDHNILAAGDCANFPFGSRRIRLESVGNAIEQGEAAANTALGFRYSYNAQPWFWSDQYDIKLKIAGLSSGYDKVVERKEKRSLSLWYFLNQKLIAVDAINDARAYMVAKKLIELNKSPDECQILDLELDLKSLLKSN